MNATRLRVELDERGYDIVVGSGLLGQIYELVAPVLTPGASVIVVSDEALGTLYAQPVAQAMRKNGVRADVVTVPTGERSKCFPMLECMIGAILSYKPDRKTTLIAIGGGVVGDLAGFGASMLLRGVPFIQIPTSLLAQVDSSVGGKTAINTEQGKNLVGSFYQPRLVVADVETLKTLPAREMRAGYAEIIKYGLMMDPEFYRWCLANAAAMLKGDSALQQYAVLASCRMKAAVVKADEREADMRALLNFGHTFGHALEAETAYGPMLNHGEAVAIGMVMACRLSARMGLIGEDVEQELAAHLRGLGLPAQPRDIVYPWHGPSIARHFSEDKKAEGGALTFVVLDALGKARVAKKVDPALALEVVESFLKG